MYSDSMIEENAFIRESYTYTCRPATNPEGPPEIRTIDAFREHAMQTIEGRCLKAARRCVRLGMAVQARQVIRQQAATLL